MNYDRTKTAGWDLYTNWLGAHKSIEAFAENKWATVLKRLATVLEGRGLVVDTQKSFIGVRPTHKTLDGYLHLTDSYARTNPRSLEDVRMILLDALGGLYKVEAAGPGKWQVDLER